ncbi:thioredoxin-like domain-containing protein [Leptolyngbya ohadii]|uniref:thioredoxin-like domain-containing protein n=1 Tax=Leptolyngbya ohadii TaxID=1962290 RepID=UPI001CEC364A|nr:thioredoxin-like domain-containing protein [Leptolyngbya ohadii]
MSSGSFGLSPRPMARIRSPELSQTLPWLNTLHPLSLRGLRGRIVLLDFWTYGCINCLHVIPDLQYLKEKYAQFLTIISIHTAKFNQEQNVESIQQAVSRYGIVHPVLVDRNRTLWDQYAIRAYPTFVLIDPQGYIVTTLSGEGRRQTLDDLIQKLIAEHLGKSTLDEQALTDIMQPQSLLTEPLAFPGKVLAVEAIDTLFIADTGHHRLVMTTLAGSLKGTIGTGVAGRQDGDWETVQFAAPQGMAIDARGQVLYVADAGNHLIRRVDLRQQQVTTIAGTGIQSRLLFPHGGRAREVDLNSPWDLVLLGNQLCIAMAGSHQIWIMDLMNGTTQTLIGTGAEFCVDGAPEEAAFAQPYGITTDGTRLFVADSETSSIRTVSLTPTPIAATLCGQGQLDGFGDRIALRRSRSGQADQDGIGENVQLQHCSGVTYTENSLWVADTYNHKIKQVDPVTGACRTITGGDTAELQEGVGRDARFWEPSGLSWAGNTLYVADTNNHAIRCLNLDSLEVTTLPLPDLCSPFICSPIR